MKTKVKKTTKAAQAKRTSAKKAAKANGQATKPAKMLSQIEAAVEVLRAAGEPMTCKAMVEAMAAKMLWASPGGKTPEATLYANIARDRDQGEARPLRESRSRPVHGAGVRQNQSQQPPARPRRLAFRKENR